MSIAPWAAVDAGESDWSFWSDHQGALVEDQGAGGQSSPDHFHDDGGLDDHGGHNAGAFISDCGDLPGNEESSPPDSCLALWRGQY